MKDKQKQLDEALDRILSGPIGQRKEWQWEVSFLKKGQKFTQEHKDKIAASKVGKKRPAEAIRKMKEKKTGVKRGPFSSEHKAKIAAAHKGKKKPKLSEYHKNNPLKVNQGRDNKRYGTGNLYKELTTGFTGYSYDMKERFPGWKAWLVNRKNPNKSSFFPGLTWIKLDVKK